MLFWCTADHQRRSGGSNITNHDESTRPSVKQIAYAADLSTATVDRVLNNRPGVRDKTRRKVEAAIDALRHSDGRGVPSDVRDLRLGFVLNSSKLVVAGYQALIPEWARRTGLRHEPRILHLPSDDVERRAEEIGLLARGLDGLILAARTSEAIVAQINAVVEAGTEVVCVTTDFPGTRRLCYVGMDQMVAGRLAARLVALRGNSEDQLIALHIGRNWRSEGEREMGFRSTLRDLNFKGRIVELLTSGGSNDEAQSLLEGLRAKGQQVDAVYSPSSGVVGLARAVADQPPERRTFIIGHEVFAPLKTLLLENQLGAQIATDHHAVLGEGLRMILRRRAGQPVPSSVFLPAHIVMKENVSALDWY